MIKYEVIIYDNSLQNQIEHQLNKTLAEYASQYKINLREYTGKING